MEDLLTKAVIIAFTLGVAPGAFFGAYLHGRMLLKKYPMPKYKIGDCVVFEHDREKNSGVICAVRWGYKTVPQRSWYNDIQFNPITNVMIEYEVDTRHARFDKDIHLSRTYWMTMGKPKFVWISESEIGTAYEEEDANA